MSNPSQTELNKPLWITLFSCLNELPADQIERVLGLDELDVRRLKLISREYVADLTIREAEAFIERQRAKAVAGPWVPPEEDLQ